MELSLPPTPSRQHPTTPPSGRKKPGLKFAVFSALMLIAILSIGFVGGLLGARYVKSGTAAQKEQVILQTQGELIRNLAEKVGPSVVSITAKGQTFNTYYGQSQEEGAGTGIILTEDGLIVTNRHVVPTGTTEVSVTLADGTVYEGVKIVGRTGTNDSLDIAFLKIADTEGKKLTPATIGDSSAMKVGDSVIAIGNALGQFQNTVTSGIVSGYGRHVQASNSDGSEVGDLENLFQTDAAINAGNSGGPLVNLQGEVIGINTAVAAGDAQSIGFAIPINDVAGLIASVKEKGVLERPFLGVVYIALTNDAAEYYSLSVDRGAYIPPSSQGKPSIITGGPAEKAGLKPGDIITKIDDQAVDQSHSLSSIINKHRVGDQVTLTILRDGKEQTLTATLGAAPTD